MFEASRLASFTSIGLSTSQATILIGQCRRPQASAEPLSDLVDRTGADRLVSLAAFVPPSDSDADPDAVPASCLALKSGARRRCPGRSGRSPPRCTSMPRQARSAWSVSPASLWQAVSSTRSQPEQLTGGMIWVSGSALLEETVLDGGHYRDATEALASAKVQELLAAQ